jgi:hypothetical protein
MTAAKTALLAMATLMLSTSAWAAPATTTYTSTDGLPARMKALQTANPGRVTIAKMNGKPVYFVNTQNFSTSAKAEQFRVAVLKALGTNTVRAWNTTDWLQVGTGMGINKSLSAANQGKHFALFNHFVDQPWALPCSEETCVLIKLTNAQLKNKSGKGFDQYMTAIRNDFYGTLGETEYNGDYNGPPFVTGRTSSKHNCTSWFTNWLQKKVGGGLEYGADPGSWCQSTARSGATPVRGLLVFNHPNTPTEGAKLPSSFNLYWGDVH